MAKQGSEVRLSNCKAHDFKHCTHLFFCISKHWHDCGRTSSPIFSFFLFFKSNLRHRSKSNSYSFLLYQPYLLVLFGHRFHKVQYFNMNGLSCIIIKMHFLIISGLELWSLFKWHSTPCPLLFPWTIACQAPLSMRFPRQEYWRELPFSSPGDLPDSGTELTFPSLTSGFFTTEPPGKPLSAPCNTHFLQVWVLNST